MRIRSLILFTVVVIRAHAQETPVYELSTNESEKEFLRKHALVSELGKSGPEKTYSKSGKLLEIYYKDSLRMQFYENGNLRSVTKYKKGKIDGERMFYYENEKVELMVRYEKGMQDGPFVLYHENGAIKYNGEFKGGRMYGERVCYDEKGNLLNGDFEFYGFNKSKYKGTCINGKPDGKVLISDREGKPLMEASFKKGRPHGITYNYKDGKISSAENYSEGQFVDDAPY